MKSITIDGADLAATEELGRRLGPHLFAGAVIGLVGQLGAGKTHFTRAVAVGLGIRNPAVVNSPTFVLIQEYQARLPIYHFDTYRLANADSFSDLGVHEYFHGDGVCLIEWADRFPDELPGERLDVMIQILDPNRRRFVLTAWGDRYEELLLKSVVTSE
jgi:tRNA threonylcarbamoyladenosine biosynthesis protein TsaE